MFETTACILLASGLSRRFEGGDKLQADIQGKPVLERAAESVSDVTFATKLAVIGEDQTWRREAAVRLGFETVSNDAPARGQGYALARGCTAAVSAKGVTSVLVLLADMPFVTTEHIYKLKAAFDEGADVAISVCRGVSSPPALFSEACFGALQTLSGDQGAKQVINAFASRVLVEAKGSELADIDTRDDLKDMEANLIG